MKEQTIKLIKIIVFLNAILFCSLSNAESIKVFSASNYPYKNLINRAHDVNVFYITNDESFSCRVEVVLGGMKWVSVEKIINKDFHNSDFLPNCLSRETAEQILLQTFLQFGRGL
tara:strand:+ start:86 stop:430 length:345 start_codon:yes stop_codon:yes gene_type:complete